MAASPDLTLGTRARLFGVLRGAWFVVGVASFQLTVSACASLPFGSRPGASSNAASEMARANDANDAKRRSDGTATALGSDDCVGGGAGESTTDDDGDDEHTTLDDGFDAPPDPNGATASSGPVPFSNLTDSEIDARLRADIASLGPMSIGRPHGGALVAGMRMPEGEHWELVSPNLAWGTRETVDGLARAMDAVAARFPDTPKVFVGDISAKNGGHLHPHVSHQAGRDVDLSYYLTQGHRWYQGAGATNLDRPRTWHLIRTLLVESDIDLILVDLKIQHLLKAYALEIGEDRDWLDQLFQAGGKSRRPIIFHAKGHATHLHVRFYNAEAQELGRRAYRYLVAHGRLTPPTLYITHTVKPGETLSHLALRYKVTTDAIKKANDLKKDLLKVNKPYKIPQKGGVAMPARVAIPQRRLPPDGNLVADARLRRRSDEPCRRASAR